MSRSGCSEHPAYNPSLVNLWLLGYAAEAAHLSGGRIIVEVRPRPVGFQTLQIRLPQADKPLRELIPDTEQQSASLLPARWDESCQEEPAAKRGAAPGGRWSMRARQKQPTPTG